MRRLLLGLLVVAAVVAGVALTRDQGSGLDLDAIAACATDRVVEAPTPIDGGDLGLEAERVVEIDDVLTVETWPDGRLLLGTRAGEVLLLDEDGNAESVLDLADRVGELRAEVGLLGMAVAPDGEHLYVNHTDEDGASHLLRFTIEGDDVDLGSETELLVEDHPGEVHIGGAIAFGPVDGYLYVGFGDGSLRVSQARKSRNLDELDAKILRIDPDDSERGYAIPDDNPFVEDFDARAEIVITGVRNPWRLDFTPDGDLWIADVGNDCYEEINVVEADRIGEGVNLGWPDVEAEHLLMAGSVAEAQDLDLTYPLYTYPHEGACAVIGGVFYVGSGLPGLDGAFVFSDFCNGVVRWIRPGAVPTLGEVGVTLPDVQSIERGPSGDIYVLSASRGVFRLVDPDRVVP